MKSIEWRISLLYVPPDPWKVDALNKLFITSTILVENIWYKNAKNVYYARSMIERHYKGETYQLQIDSHILFEKDWDTRCIKMLHNTENAAKRSGLWI